MVCSPSGEKNRDFVPERVDWFSTPTNAGEKPQKIFEMCKFRNDVEEVFNVFKNLLNTDTPYLKDDDSLRGYVFLSFLSLIAYYRVLKLLKEKHVNSRISAKDAIFQLSKIYLTDIGNRTISGRDFEEVTRSCGTAGNETRAVP